MGVKCINSNSNSIDLIIKSKIFTALKQPININYLELQAIKWVKWKDI